MQQLSFLEAPVPDGAAPVWNVARRGAAGQSDRDARPADRQDDRRTGARP